MEAVCFGLAVCLVDRRCLETKEVPVLDGAGVVGQWLGEVSARWTFSTEFASFDLR